MKKNKQELILKVGAAGGSISVWSVNANDDTQSFVVKRDESTLREFIDEEDAVGINFKSKSGLLSSFADALVILGRYPWHSLYPMFVHQDFMDPVLTAVMDLGGEKEVTRWQRRLKGQFCGHFTSP
ncbi:MAG: hypothetical protein V1736_09615 [Pseudomonadota bacterium]